jgi:hypothetical protein
VSNWNYTLDCHDDKVGSDPVVTATRWIEQEPIAAKAGEKFGIEKSSLFVGNSSPSFTHGPGDRHLTVGRDLGQAADNLKRSSSRFPRYFVVYVERHDPS